VGIEYRTFLALCGRGIQFTRSVHALFESDPSGEGGYWGDFWFGCGATDLDD
jgi:hypothetical protein